MCGIAGIVLKPNSPMTDIVERVIHMRDVMAHRGPDDAGCFLAPNGRIALANRRLAIRDLSSAAHMPLANDDGTVVITHNGEIYNTDELRLELEQRGFVFHSSSDTEVILHGYEAWGVQIVSRLRGMFAFAIADLRCSSRAPRVLLARDRLGIKPLYYAQTSETFLFASELKGLMAAQLVGKEISPAGLVGYLLFGSVPNPWTIYDDIRALEPGCTLVISLDAPALPTPQRYWALPTDESGTTTYEQAVAQVRELLAESVRIRLISDVPLGAFLSGGLDSSIVVGLMRQATNGPIRTCSMVFREANYNEASFARVMAEAVGAEHYERIITADDVTAELDRILCAMDQPTIDGVNTYFVSKTAREAGLTVALSGLGGDELFGGYPNTFQGVPRLYRMIRRVRHIPGGVVVARWYGRKQMNAAQRFRFEDTLARPVSLSSAYWAMRGLFASQEARVLVTPEIWNAAIAALNPLEYISAHALNQSDATRDFAWLSRAELAMYTHNQLLRDADVMSMAHSLEVRVPLLDHHLVETVLRLPQWVLERGNGPKRLMLAAQGQVLPNVIRKRQDKMGFSVPLGLWMERVVSPNALEDAARGPLRGYINVQGLENARRNTSLDETHWARRWGLDVLGMWVANAYF